MTYRTGGYGGPFFNPDDIRPATTSHQGLMPTLGAASATLGGFVVTGGGGGGSTINTGLATGALAGAMPPQHFSLVGQLFIDGAWTAPSFAANWSNLLGTSVALYKRDILGWICLSGIVTKSVALAFPDTIYTLPAGFRPTTAKRFPQVSTGGAICQILINTTGTVQIEAGGTNAYVNLEGIRYDPAT